MPRGLRTTIEYKSGTRAHIASLGYSIMADFGDQYSDLLGGNAGHQVKIPRDAPQLSPRSVMLIALRSAQTGEPGVAY